MEYPMIRNGILWLALSSATIAPTMAATLITPAPERRIKIIELVREDCGSCHGSQLKGGLGPPLLPKFLRDKSSKALEQVILNGRPGTPMPPWRPFFTPSEAHWIVTMLKRGFPDAPN